MDGSSQQNPPTQDHSPAPSSGKEGHTAGPWTFEWSDVPYAELGEAWTVDAAGGSICTLDGFGAGNRNEANARLISASPDLLEACQKAVEWLSGWQSAEPYIDVLRAAIAKATAAEG